MSDSFKILFLKLAELKELSEQDLGSSVEEISVLCDEAEEIEKLRKIVLKTTEIPPRSYTTS